MKKEKKIEVISCRPQKHNKWIFKEIEKERKKTNSPSFSNTVETILLNYFESKK